jgi:DNA-directed RNA polymerase specialized sigma24 family protein
MATPNLTTAVSTVLERLHRQTPVRRVAMANDVQRQLSEAQMAVTREKTAAVRELRGQGYKLKDIAEMLDVSIARVKQIEEGGRAAEKVS